MKSHRKAWKTIRGNTGSISKKNPGAISKAATRLAADPARVGANQSRQVDCSRTEAKVSPGAMKVRNIRSARPVPEPLVRARFHGVLPVAAQCTGDPRAGPLPPGRGEVPLMVQLVFGRHPLLRAVGPARESGRPSGPGTARSGRLGGKDDRDHREARSRVQIRVLPGGARRDVGLPGRPRLRRHPGRAARRHRRRPEGGRVGGHRPGAHLGARGIADPARLDRVGAGGRGRCWSTSLSWRSTAT